MSKKEKSDCNLDKDISSSDDNFVIVIGRQFGSGGRRVGRIIANELGIDYYDTEILSEAAERLGLAKEIFIANDEKKPSVLRTILQGAYGIPDNFHTVSLSGERIYAEQSRVIKDISKMGSCVIVGRTADYILRDYPRILSVFLHSPLEYRAKEIVRRGDAKNYADALDLAQKEDKKRESYYNYYTSGERWGKAMNYHFTIDTSGLNMETVAEMIIKFANYKKLI